ncbi:MAG: hypothetical protein A4E53_01218 [Pelotomaculum sp. PtaB.Bin104]|nr:MAG: hypothetical protein A4E53_01218 [Pelotomaculum sp. PtaB.Bin104]
MDKVIEAIELPDGHTSLITEELLTRRTLLGKIVRNYMEQKNAASSIDERYEATRKMLLNIFERIDEGDDKLRLEFHMTMLNELLNELNDSFC